MATEKRLIDANELDAIIWERYDKAFMQSKTRPNKAWWEGYSAGVNYARNTVTDMPTVDAVEVVRCKDCKHWLPYPSLGVNDCGLHKGLVLTKENTYCSYGERKDNG